MTRRSVSLLLSALLLAVGAVLLAYMVTVEGEPGAIPLLLVGGGAAWHVVVRAGGRARTDRRRRPRRNAGAGDRAGSPDVE